MVNGKTYFPLLLIAGCPTFWSICVLNSKTDLLVPRKVVVVAGLGSLCGKRCLVPLDPLQIDNNVHPRLRPAPTKRWRTKMTTTMTTKTKGIATPSMLIPM